MAMRPMLALLLWLSLATGLVAQPIVDTVPGSPGLSSASGRRSGSPCSWCWSSPLCEVRR